MLHSVARWKLRIKIFPDRHKKMQLGKLKQREQSEKIGEKIKS
jgi:hypothetical protein